MLPPNQQALTPFGGANIDSLRRQRVGNKYFKAYRCVLWQHLTQLVQKSLREVFNLGVASSEDDFFIKVVSKVDVALHERGYRHLVHSLIFETHSAWVEKYLGGQETLVVQLDWRTVRKQVALSLLVVFAGLGLCQRLLVVENFNTLFLDFFDYFEFTLKN